MSLNTTVRRPVWTPLRLAITLAAVAICAVGLFREPLLRTAGWALVVSEPAAHAGIIVVSGDSGGAGALEAADLVHSGVAKRVAVFADPPSGEDYEFIRRGLPYEDAGARVVRQLNRLGVTDVVQIPMTETGSHAEVGALSKWCYQHQLRSIVVISTKDHSRRLRRMLDRAVKGYPIRVSVLPSRYSSFDPDRWWKTRSGLRTGIIELQKLLLDLLLHPFWF